MPTSNKHCCCHPENNSSLFAISLKILKKFLFFETSYFTNETDIKAGFTRFIKPVSENKVDSVTEMASETGFSFDKWITLLVNCLSVCLKSTTKWKCNQPPEGCAVCCDDVVTYSINFQFKTFTFYNYISSRTITWYQKSQALPSCCKSSRTATCPKL